MSQEKVILVVPSLSKTGSSKGGKGLFEDSVPQVVTLGTNRLKESLGAFLESTHEVLANLPKAAGPFALNEIELTVEVNSEGSVQLIGGMRVGASGGITLKLKR